MATRARSRSDHTVIAVRSMSARDYVVAALCGVAWHVIVRLLIFGTIGEPAILAGLTGIVIGGTTGVLASTLTLRSRYRRRGCEAWLDLVSSYFIVVIAYLAGLALAGVCLDGLILRDPVRSVGFLLVFLACGLGLAIPWSVIFVPLSYCTRRLVWHLHVNEGRAL